MLNEKEKNILQLIKENPYISQQELAKRLSLSRSGIAGYISSLTKKGKIRGRAYVLNEENYVLCIGGTNIDRKARVKSDFQWSDSNPVTVTETLGGVSRNIAENLVRLQVRTSLLTAVGLESHGRSTLENVSTQINTTSSIQVPDQRTGTYTAVLNEAGEMLFALAEMDIYDCITVDMLKDKWSHILGADHIILDTNFPKEVLTAIVEETRQSDVNVIVVPVSSKKMERLPNKLDGIDYFICNEEELYTLVSQLGIDCAKRKKEAMGAVVGLGVKHLVVTSGKEGVSFLSITGESGTIPAIETEINDVTGAGDSLAAGIVYGIQKNASLMEACRFGLAAASITLQTAKTVSDHLNEEALFNLLND